MQFLIHFKSRRLLTFAATLLPLLLTSCFDGGGAPPFVYTGTPVTVAQSVTFVDKHPGTRIGGIVNIERATDETNVHFYTLRWAVDGVLSEDRKLPNGRPDYIGRVERPLYIQGEPNLSYRLYPTSVPEGANSIVVVTSNPIGDAEEGVAIYPRNFIEHPDSPDVHPSNPRFVDHDPSLRVDGVLSFSPPVEGEDTITYYRTFLTDAEGCPIGHPFPYAWDSPGFRATNQTQYSTRVWHSWPVREGSRYVILPGNQFGYAYEENCEDYAVTNVINHIVPSENPTFQAKRVLISGDTEETARFTATLTIQPNDERDLSTGYFIEWEDAEGNCNQLGYRHAYGGAHSYHFDNWDIPSTARYISVSAGHRCHADRIQLDIENHYGSWYTIHSRGASGYCMEATDNSTLQLARCDEDEIGQRFNVVNVASTYDDDDDLHTIESVLYPGRYFNRTEGGVRVLGDKGADDWDGRVQLRAKSGDDKRYKKIATIRQRAAGLTYGFSCADAFPATLDNPEFNIIGLWSNCGTILGDNDIKWLFKSPSGAWGLFNDQ